MQQISWIVNDHLSGAAIVYIGPPSDGLSLRQAEQT
jgi:hypothetical protein